MSLKKKKIEENSVLTQEEKEVIQKEEQGATDESANTKRLQLATNVASGKFNIAILTHVNSLDEAVAKINFIRKYLKDTTIIPVPREISKTKMCYTKDSILVDDYSGNLQEWVKENGIGIQFSTDLNKDKGFKVIDRLDKLIDMF